MAEIKRGRTVGKTTSRPISGVPNTTNPKIPSTIPKPNPGNNPYADYYTWTNDSKTGPWEKWNWDLSSSSSSGKTTLNYNGAITRDVLGALKGIEGVTLIAPSKTSRDVKIIVPNNALAKVKGALKI